MTPRYAWLVVGTRWGNLQDAWIVATYHGDQSEKTAVLHARLANEHEETKPRDTLTALAAWLQAHPYDQARRQIDGTHNHRKVVYAVMRSPLVCHIDQYIEEHTRQ